jgi:ketosteroid isomerase-like protein
VLDRPTRLVVLAAIVAALLGLAAGCGGDEDPADEAGTSEALTTAPTGDSAQRAVSGGDRSCSDATPDVERQADSNTGCKDAGQAPDRQIAPQEDAGATSEKNAQIVHQFYEAWNRRDFHDAVRLVSQDFELHLFGASANLTGERFHGRDGLLRFMRRYAGTVGGQIKVERTIDIGERVVATGVLKTSGLLGGVAGGLRFRHIWMFRDGKVVRLDLFGRHSLGPRRPQALREALEAAGLRE